MTDRSTRSSLLGWNPDYDNPCMTAWDGCDHDDMGFSPDAYLEMLQTKISLVNEKYDDEYDDVDEDDDDNDDDDEDEKDEKEKEENKTKEQQQHQQDRKAALCDDKSSKFMTSIDDDTTKKKKMMMKRTTTTMITYQNTSIWMIKYLVMICRTVMRMMLHPPCPMSMTTMMISTTKSKTVMMTMMISTTQSKTR